MKNVGVIIFSILVAFAATSYALSSTWGKISSKDIVLSSQRVFNYSSPYGINRRHQFPAYKQTNKKKITAIQAIDNSPNRTACYGTLFAGGPGYKYATVNFLCQYGARTNLDFQVTIYGKK